MLSSTVSRHLKVFTLIADDIHIRIKIRIKT
jgi:hypothetical protein